MCEAHEILHEVRLRLRTLELAVRDLTTWLKADSANYQRTESELKKLRDNQEILTQRMSKLEAGLCKERLTLSETIPTNTLVPTTVLRRTNKNLW